MTGTVINIKYSESTSVPAPGTLETGELAYSFASNQLFIGGPGFPSNTNDIIGGKKFTDYLDHTPGTLTASSAILVDSNKWVDEIITGGLTLTTSGGSGTQKVVSISTGIDALSTNGQLVTALAVKNYVDSTAAAVDLGELNDVTITSATTAQVLLYDGINGIWINKGISGDATLASTGALTLATVNSNVGTFGEVTASNTKVPVLTVNAKGLITSISHADVATTLNVSADGANDIAINLLSETLDFIGTAGETTVATNGVSNSITIGLDDFGTATAGSAYGSATAIPVITVDSKGRVSSLSTASVATALSIADNQGTPNSDTVSLLTDTLTFSGIDGITTTVSNNEVSIGITNSITGATKGSATAVPVITYNNQGLITSVTESVISTVTTVSDGTNSSDVASGDAITFAGASGETTTSWNSLTDTLTIGLPNVGPGALSNQGSSTSIPVISIDAKGRVTGLTTTSINANSYGTFSVDQAGTFSWADSGTTVASSNADTVRLVSGAGINLQVDSANDAIKFNNTGVLSNVAGTHITVSGATGNVTIGTDATSANTAGTIVARDSNGDFAAGTATLGEVQVDDININGNTISVTTTDTNLKLVPNGTGVVEVVGDTDITGNVTITGDLVITGTGTQVNVQELVVEDPIIYLASAVSGTESTTDVGFVANYVDNGNYAHTGLVRHKADGIWYLFDGYTREVDDDGNVITPVVGQDGFQIASLYANIVGGLQGTSDEALTLAVPRAIKLAGDVTGNVDGSVKFDGSSDITITTTIAAGSVDLTTDTTGDYVATLSTSNGGLTITGSGSNNAAVAIELDTTDTTFTDGAKDAAGASINAGTYTNMTLSYSSVNKTVTGSVNTATSGQTGVASFSADNFDVTAGHVTIVRIDGGTF